LVVKQLKFTRVEGASIVMKSCRYYIRDETQADANTSRRLSPVLNPC